MIKPAVLCDDCGYLLTDGDPDGKTDCHASDYIAELEAENEQLKEMVIRMYQHCSFEKAELTEAESEEWMTQAAALEDKS